MKKMFIIITAVSMVSASIAMAAQNEADAYLNLSGTISTQLAIDINTANNNCLHDHECSASLGDLTIPFNNVVASVGVLANKAFRIKQSSLNGLLKGVTGTSSASGALAYRIGLNGVDNQISTQPFEIYLEPVNGYVCSLKGNACPFPGPSARMDVGVKHDGDFTLPAGNYEDQVKFSIEDASGV